MKSIALFVSMCVAAGVIATAQERAPQEKREGTAILWRDPGPIPAKDLYWGAGSAERSPKTPFTFLAEDLTGTKPKVSVRDANGTEWQIKFAGPSPKDNEVHAEIAASRLTWAFGYFVEEHYYVAEGKIDGVKALKRAAGSVAPDGTFRVARFERRSQDVIRTGRRWSFERNPFSGSREMGGLKILTILLGNWDTKSSNTEVFQVRTADGGVEDRYLFTDLGSTFGRTGPAKGLFIPNSRWNLEDFGKHEFIDGVTSDRINFHYEGSPRIDLVPVEYARWFSGLASQLTDAQVRRAFEASGAPTAEVDGFSARVIAKIQELQHAVEGRWRPDTRERTSPQP
jgi:hypothetical protein